MFSIDTEDCISLRQDIIDDYQVSVTSCETIRFLKRQQVKFLTKFCCKNYLQETKKAFKKAKSSFDLQTFILRSIKLTK